MIAAFLERAGKLSIQEIERPSCGPNDALISIRTTGICGSDLHYFREGRIKNNIVTEPLVLGHESAGVIVEVGANVHHLSPGDRVTVEPGLPCLQCTYCLHGRYNLCNKVRFLGAPPNHGTFREYVTHNALFVHKLPENVSLDVGATVEPLAVGFHAVSRARIRLGEKVLVMGAGPIGLVVMLFARLAGADVTVLDRDDYRLGVATQMGSDEVIRTPDATPPSSGYDCVIEATGDPGIYPLVVEAVGKGGRIVVVGMSNEAPSVDLTALMRKEAEIITIYRYANAFPPVLDLLGKGRIQVNSLVTHRFPLQDIVAAFEFANSADRDKVKVLIDGPEE